MAEPEAFGSDGKSGRGQGRWEPRRAQEGRVQARVVRSVVGGKAYEACWGPREPLRRWCIPGVPWKVPVVPRMLETCSRIGRRCARGRLPCDRRDGRMLVRLLFHTRADTFSGRRVKRCWTLRAAGVQDGVPLRRRRYPEWAGVMIPPRRPPSKSAMCASATNLQVIVSWKPRGPQRSMQPPQEPDSPRLVAMSPILAQS